MQAWLEGSILYVGDREFGYDYSPQEAAEQIESLQGFPGAPTGVRIFTRPRTKRKKSQTGWPVDLSAQFQYGPDTGWPKA